MVVSECLLEKHLAPFTVWHSRGGELHPWPRVSWTFTLGVSRRVEFSRLIPAWFLGSRVPKHHTCTLISEITIILLWYEILDLSLNDSLFKYLFCMQERAYFVSEIWHLWITLKCFLHEWTLSTGKRLGLQPSKVITLLNIDVESHRGLDGYYQDPGPGGGFRLLLISVQSITQAMVHLPFDRPV